MKQYEWGEERDYEWNCWQRMMQVHVINISQAPSRDFFEAWWSFVIGRCDSPFPSSLRLPAEGLLLKHSQTQLPLNTCPK